MGFSPKFKLYNSTGVTLGYTFSAVQYTNAPQTTKKLVEVRGQRGIGSVIISGGDKDSWELVIRGTLYNETGNDYIGLTSKIDAMETAIVLDTPYILRIDRSGSAYYEYKVKRIKPISYGESFRLNFQTYDVRFQVNTW